MKKISIIDCEIGNRASIRNMLKRMGHDAQITREHGDITASDLLILPGVGSFDAFMQALQSFGLIDVLTEAVVREKTPVLGICLGMQVLFDKSEEGQRSGLGWIEGDVRSLKKMCGANVKLPHIGWREVTPRKNSFIPEGAQYYFVHNYCCNPSDSEDAAGTITLDGQEIVVAAKRDNIYGVQFHPEKSHKYGFEFFGNFLNHVW